MKKYVIFLSFALVCSVVSFFIPIVNFGMLFSFIVICFLFGRSFSEKKPANEKINHLDYERERAGSSLLAAGLITGILIFAGISLKTFFFVWDIVSMNDTFRIENLHLVFITCIVIIAPIFLGYYFTRLINAVISFRFKIRID